MLRRDWIAVGLATAFALALIVAPAFASRPAPCVVDPEAPFYLHDGTEAKRAVYWGSGADRQIIVLCAHVNPNLGYLQTPIHMLHVVADPEPTP